MRLALLASAAFVALGATAWAQDADHMSPNHDSMRGSQQMGGDRDRHGGGDAARDDRADRRHDDHDASGRRDAKGDPDERERTKRTERVDRDDMRREHAGARDTMDHERRDRKEVIDRDHVRERTVRDHDGEAYREGIRTGERSVRRHVSINPERRTRYRDAFVKTYKSHPVEDVDVRVGTRIPDRVVVDRVPETYYEEEPDLRGLNYFVDRGHAYLVDPDSREVIDDLD